MGQSLMVTSGKGGVGKTTVTGNLGITLAEHGFRVIVLDMDFGLNNLDMLFGLPNSVRYGIEDVLLNKCRWKQAINHIRSYDEFYLMPSASKTKMVLRDTNFSVILEEIKSEFDYVILDTAAGADENISYLSSICDKILLIVTPEIASVHDGYYLIHHCLEQSNQTEIKTIINQEKSNVLFDRGQIEEHKIQELLQTNVVGKLSHYAKATYFFDHGDILVGCNKRAKKQFNQITKALLEH